MNLINNGFHRSDTDFQNGILEEVRNNLSQMKPDIISSIVEEVMCKINSRYSSRIGKLESRISELEQYVSNAQSTPVQKEAPTGTARHSKKIDMSKLEIRIGFRFDGWIYYMNDDMGKFLYRVREDGSENTQLTDYSVSLVKRVEGGYLYYLDGTYNEKKLKLS